MALNLDLLRKRLLTPYDQQLGELDRTERDATHGLSQLETDTQLANERDTSEYNRSLFDLGKQREGSLTGLDEGLADRGILRSGMNLTGRERIGEQYTTNVEAIARRLSGSKEDRARALQKAREETQRRIGDLNLDRTRIKTEREQQQAIDEAEANAAQMQAEQERQQQERQQAEMLAASQPQITPTGQYLPPSGQGGGPWASWESQNATKPYGQDLPEWQRMGFPSEAIYNAIMRRY